MSLPLKYGNQKPDLKKLRSIHRRILRMEAMGTYTREEIAEANGVSVSMVNTTVNSQLGQQKIAVMQGMADLQVVDVLADLRSLAPLAVELYGEVLSDEASPTRLRMMAAKEVLDRGGYPASKVIETKPLMGDDEIAAIKARAKKNAEEMGIITEAKVIKEEKDGS